MKQQDKIPTTKVERASKFITTGVKIGGNYVKNYVKHPFDAKKRKDELDKENASDIYDSLSELKGSALKIAQILSMDKNVLPKAYTDKFSLAQYSAPPLSYPLVKKTFKNHFDKAPEDIFDTFSKSAINAASLGQVHKATKDGKTYAVKVQYPGVADSIQSDLQMVKPFALKLLEIKAKEIDPYFKEVEQKLLEEADYKLEIKNSIAMTEACQHIPNVKFPKYYKEYSSKRIITMDWMDGLPLTEWLKTNPSKKDRNKIGQAMWDLYQFQIHELRQIHADPHPGNFLVNDKAELIVVDFGCTKKIPKSFYKNYFELVYTKAMKDETRTEELFYELELFLKKDSEKDKQFVKGIFMEMMSLVAQPIYAAEFDFGDDDYFQRIFEMGEKFSKDPKLRKLQARGSRHFIYFNRTYFGLYNILNSLKANITTAFQYNKSIASLS